MFRSYRFALVAIWGFLSTGCGSIVDPNGAGDGADVTISVDPGRALVRAGDIAAVEVSISRGEGRAEGVTLSVDGVPAGVIAAPAYVAADGDSAVLVLETSSAAGQGERPLTVIATTDSGGTANADLRLLVAGPPGTLDTSFAEDGTFNHAPAERYFGRDILAQDDGKILIGGNSVQQATVFRLNADGTFDPSWGDGGIASSGIGDQSNCLAMIARASGDLACSGATNGIGSDFDFGIHAFTSDGQADTAFSSDGVTSHDPAAESFSEFLVVGEASNGDLVVAGNQFILPGFTPVNALGFRFSSAGVEDNTYTIDEPSTSLQAGLLQPDGKLVLVGGRGGGLWIARYNEDSTPDTSFGTGGTIQENFGGAGGAGKGVILLEDGTLSIYALSGGNVVTAKYDDSGVPVAEYGTNGIEPTQIALTGQALNAAVMDAQGRLVVVGTQGDLPAVVRLLPNGNRDALFGDFGKTVLDFDVSGNNLRAGGFGIAIDRDGRILVVGQGGPDFGEQILVGRLWP